jgi:diacylglycerol kinase
MKQRMILENLPIVAGIVFVDPFFAYISLAFIVGGSILMYLIVKSAGEFSVEETEKNADEFAGIIKDSHGPVTTWLWVVYVAMIVWAIAYLIQHAGEFVNFP